MKKLSTLFMLALVVLGMAMVSCSKDEPKPVDKDVKIISSGASVVLSGTTADKDAFVAAVQGVLSEELKGVATVQTDYTSNFSITITAKESVISKVEQVLLNLDYNPKKLNEAIDNVNGVVMCEFKFVNNGETLLNYVYESAVYNPKGMWTYTCEDGTKYIAWIGGKLSGSKYQAAFVYNNVMYEGEMYFTGQSGTIVATGKKADGSETKLNLYMLFANKETNSFSGILTVDNSLIVKAVKFEKSTEGTTFSVQAKPSVVDENGELAALGIDKAALDEKISSCTVLKEGQGGSKDLLGTMVAVALEVAFKLSEEMDAQTQANPELKNTKVYVKLDIYEGFTKESMVYANSIKYYYNPNIKPQ